MQELTYAAFADKYLESVAQPKGVACSKGLNYGHPP